MNLSLVLYVGDPVLIQLHLEMLQKAIGLSKAASICLSE